MIEVHFFVNLSLVPTFNLTLSGCRQKVGTWVKRGKRKGGNPRKKEKRKGWRYRRREKKRGAKYKSNYLCSVKITIKT